VSSSVFQRLLTGSLTLFNFLQVSVTVEVVVAAEVVVEVALVVVQVPASVVVAAAAVIEEDLVVVIEEDSAVAVDEAAFHLEELYHTHTQDTFVNELECTCHSWLCVSLANSP